MTKTQLDKAREYIPSLFAAGASADIHEVGTQESGFAFFQGIPSSYSSRTGKKVCRSDINGLGRLVSQAKWFNQLGGYYTFNVEVSDAIGGYPLGAILYYKDPESGVIRLVRSMIPDNTYDFTEDGTYINDEFWSYVDNVEPKSFRPRIFPDWNQEVVGEGANGLSVGQELHISGNCLFSIQRGANIDTTEDNSDLSIYLTVKRADDDTFYTAALLAFIPGSAAVITQGIYCVPDYIPPSEYLSNGLHAYNSPAPVQVYLNAGDTVKIVCNRDYKIAEKFEYRYYPLGN